MGCVAKLGNSWARPQRRPPFCEMRPLTGREPAQDDGGGRAPRTFPAHRANARVTPTPALPSRLVVGQVTEEKLLQTTFPSFSKAATSSYNLDYPL